MAEDGETKPDMIIGIDFGMTCTGVAYINLTTGSDYASVIQKWPGKGHLDTNKVATLLTYRLNEDVPQGWGFTCGNPNQLPEDVRYVDLWKILLVPKELERERTNNTSSTHDVPSNMGEVEKWCEDYLRLLYSHIEARLTTELYGTTWQNARIEFIFSVPTTWLDKTIVERFRFIALRAGYQRHTNHVMKIGLTEAEAAAVHVSKAQVGLFKKGSIIMSCDAGGGTTDMSVLKVQSNVRNALSLQQLDVVFGGYIGSVAIDLAFEELVRSRLELANTSKPLGLSTEEIEDLAWSVRESDEYQTTKCDYGSNTNTQLPTFTCPLPKLSPDYSNPNYKISGGSITFARRDFQSLFDDQLRKLYTIIDKQIERIAAKCPGEEITHFVLSGGLGNSAYVQQKLKAKYEKGGTTNISTIRNMVVRIAPEPQLAVCKGLVEDRTQKLLSGQSIVTIRCCRESYGVLCAELRDPNRDSHVSRRTMVDEIDGRTYCMDMVQWLIKSGEPISTDTVIKQSFHRSLAPGSMVRDWTSYIVGSRIDKGLLVPYKSKDVYEVCTVKTNLGEVTEKQMEQRERRSSGLFGRSKKYFLCNYEIRVLVGAADLQFELWFQGKKLSKPNSTRVQFHSVEEIDDE